MEGRKRFFFEKKKQKTFGCLGLWGGSGYGRSPLLWGWRRWIAAPASRVRNDGD
jgi:hypothetical protein